MTTSQNSQAQSQASALSYSAAATKKSTASSPAVAVGTASGPGQQNGSNAQANARPIPPAVPAVVNGSSNDHSRKSSVTINGGPVGGQKAGGIQFGSITDSPAASHSTPQIVQSSSAPIAIPGGNNNTARVPSPAQSPSPIPQPVASGGRPPSVSQGNGMTFGSLGGDGDRHMRQASGSQGPTLGTSPGHLRRESSQSTHSEQSGRGGFAPQGGRGRGGFQQQYQGHQGQQMGYPPPGPGGFRGGPGAGRGAMAPAFQSQSRPMQYPNSPHQAARSPALANSIPGTPNMNAAMPMHPQQYGYYPPQQVLHPSSSYTPSQSQNFNNKSGSNGKKAKGKYRSQSRDQHDHYGQHRELSGDFSDRYDRQHEPLPVNSILSADQPAFGMPDNPIVDTNLAFSDFPTLPPIQGGKIDISPESGNFDHYLTSLQYGYPQAGFDRMSGIPMNGGQFMYPQMPYMTGPPQSPQTGFNAPMYTPGQYAAQQPPAMSRTPSQMSERPNSSLGQPQTPSMTPATNASTPQINKSTPTASPAFTRTQRKSAAIVIKRPDGEALDLSGVKAPASPATSLRSGTPPVVASTPTPPPKSITPAQHSRTDSVNVSKDAKDKEQKIQEFKEQMKKAAEADKAAEAKPKEEVAAKAAEPEVKEEPKPEPKEEVKPEPKDEPKEAPKEEPKEEVNKEKEAEDAAAAEAKKKQEEEDEFERQIQEMEAAEAEREKKEAEILAKRNAEKAAAEKVEAEKRAANAAEEDRKLREQEREMERLEDERERKRQEEEKKGASADTKPVADALASDAKSNNKEAAKEAFTTPSTIASKLRDMTLADDSGASAPSDDSAGSASKAARGKPAALNLAPLNTKPVEAPQPSAALQSLKSARYLTAINPSIYPPNINSPNPALNSAVTTKGKSFKYDKEFLLQFQKVFTEKPSVEFDAQIKALIGDGDAGSARSGSTRTPGGMGPRSNSTRTQPGAFAMGNFAAGGKTLPPGTTSAERFAMSAGAIPRPQVASMSSFGRPGGAFPAGNQMGNRTPSSNMGSMPHSPRTNSRGGNSKRGNHSKGPDESKLAKTMPLTAGMELKPIKITEGGWKPRSVMAQANATGAAGPAPGAGADGHMQPDMVQRKVKAALNKMTPEKFDKIADQILAIAAQSKDEADGRTLRQVIQLTFEKATDEAHWASMYAKFCKRMLETMNPDIKDESILDKNGNIVSGGNLFRKYLLNRCQEEFERGWKTELPDKPEGERGEEKTEEAAMLSDEYYIAAAAKRRGLGLVQFIGELYKLGMLTERIMHECVKKLVDYTGIPDEAEVESLTKLLKTIGGNLDSTEKGKPMMDVYFHRIQAMIDTPELPSRLKFMLMDIVDLRKKRWHSKEDNKGPKTLEEIRAEAEAAAAQKQAESLRGNQRGGGGGGGGRMQMGRGDSRNFSNGYGMPPPDYNKNTVEMGDLRRLTNKNRQTSQGPGQMSFGPTSMFASRSSSGRKMGPGGSLSRTGEDSGASSRAGTPPAKDKVSANAFSLLSGLDSNEPENPASPPSTHASPNLAKSTPAGDSDKKTDA